VRWEATTDCRADCVRDQDAGEPPGERVRCAVVELPVDREDGEPDRRGRDEVRRQTGDEARDRESTRGKVERGWDPDQRRGRAEEAAGETRGDDRAARPCVLPRACSRSPRTRKPVIVIVSPRFGNCLTVGGARLLRSRLWRPPIHSSSVTSRARFKGSRTNWRRGEKGHVPSSMKKRAYVKVTDCVLLVVSPLAAA
jgi:hypothetical protein